MNAAVALLAAALAGFTGGPRDALVYEPGGPAADATLGIALHSGAEGPIVVGSEQASRRHARIFVSGGAHVLVDLDSTNGTFLNSKLVKEQTLRHGDVIRIATTVLKYLVDA